MELGLALSGGGFRATLYHLGVIAYLKKAKLLSCVSHVCCVSGGSVIGAHLVQNWGRYTGTDSEFDAAAKEIVALVQSDVRGHIVRRSLTVTPPLFFLRRVLQMRWLPKTTATTLLQRRFHRFYQKQSIDELYPPSEFPPPHLYVLTTNLTNGGSCSFMRNGFMIDSQPNAVFPLPHLLEAEEIPLSLAVAASSAFPALFPPVRIKDGAFGGKNLDPLNQLLTDGGVFDNLGARKFRQILDARHLDAVLISDAGLPFRREPDLRWTDAIVGTAMRASDILQERVHQLERELASVNRRFVFLDITHEVPTKPGQKPPMEKIDPAAPPLAIQRFLPYVRTDLDRFSDVLVNELSRHGFCVAAHVLSAQLSSLIPGLGELPEDLIPYVPIKKSRLLAKIGTDTKAATRHIKRAQQRSSGLFSWRDWLSYAHLAAAIAVIASLFFAGLKVRAGAITLWHSMLAVYKARHTDFQATLLREIKESHPHIMHRVREPNYDGFKVYADSRIYDLRDARVPEKPDDLNKRYSPVYVQRRLTLSRRQEISTDEVHNIEGQDPGIRYASNRNDKIHIPLKTDGFAIDVQCYIGHEGEELSEANSSLRMLRPTENHSNAANLITYKPGHREVKVYDLVVDTSQMAYDDVFVIETRAKYWNNFLRPDDQYEWILMEIDATIEKSEALVILPRGKKMQSHKLSSGPIPSNLQVNTNDYFSYDESKNTFFWMVIDPTRAYYYTINWTWTSQ